MKIGVKHTEKNKTNTYFIVLSNQTFFFKKERLLLCVLYLFFIKFNAILFSLLSTKKTTSA